MFLADYVVIGLHETVDGHVEPGGPSDVTRNLRSIERIVAGELVKDRLGGQWDRQGPNAETEDGQFLGVPTHHVTILEDGRAVQ